MGKRSNFERKKNDFYATPYEAVLPLLPFLQVCGSTRGVRYIEPCVGEGDLVKHLAVHNHTCARSYDLPYDVTTMQYDVEDVDFIITNPPWSRWILHPAIDNLRKQKPTWLLFDADWMHTKQAKDHLPYCKKIVTVGRVKWIADSKHNSLDNAAWYLFGNNITPTTFYGKEGRL
jgi:hypothetical protein